MFRITPIIRHILFPFTWVYYISTYFRNKFYDWGIFKSFKVPIHSISVGNITVGGTGKTPFVDYLLRFFASQSSAEIAFLSRGYARETKGFVLIKAGHSAKEVGDEPKLLFDKHKQHRKNPIHFFVGEDRVAAYHKIMKVKPATQLLILDDAFQHRSIIPQKQIVLIDFNRPVHKDHVFPTGDLREGCYALKRADHVIYSKCPEQLTEIEMQQLITPLKGNLKATAKVFFTKVRYQLPQPILNQNTVAKTPHLKNKQIMLITAIAKTQPLINYIMGQARLLKHFKFQDHYAFTLDDIHMIKATYQKALSDNNGEILLICTEKDMVKLRNPLFLRILKSLPIYYIPITIEFLKDRTIFEAYLTSKSE